VAKALHIAFAVYSDSNGALDINNITPIDTLLVEYSGYERKKASGIKNADTIFLKSAHGRDFWVSNANKFFCIRNKSAPNYKSGAPIPNRLCYFQAG